LKTTIFYYTGTGNSLWVARTIQKELGEATLLPVNEANTVKEAMNSEVVGLVFPVHMWGLPPRVIRFISGLKTLKPQYLFAVAVNAGQVANCLIQLKKLLAKNGLSLSSGFSVNLPSNYIPWGGPGPVEKQNAKFEAARQKLKTVSSIIQRAEKKLPEKGPVISSAVFSLIYRLSFPRLASMDRQFWADEKCNGCGICGKICLAANISLSDSKPVWGHRCEQCFACLQWCPRQAIQYGKNTAKYPRYHHPEVKLQDMLH
jgi:ferredoxin